jgi:hypothetical protein
MNDLFRAEQQEKLEEMRTEPEPADEWPRGCRGSRRPWLVFVGPSPGGKGKLDEPAHTLWNKPFTDPFHWGGGFKQSMKPLLTALMPEARETEAAFLYAVYNLDSIQEPHANRVSIERMKSGAPAVVSLLEKSPPRLIVPMEKESFNVLREALDQRRYNVGTKNEFPLTVPIAIYNNPKRLHRNLSGFRIEDGGPLRGAVVIRLPQHPAKILRADYAAVCGKAVRNLFERLAVTSN